MQGLLITSGQERRNDAREQAAPKPWNSLAEGSKWALASSRCVSYANKLEKIVSLRRDHEFVDFLRVQADVDDAQKAFVVVNNW